MLQIYNSLTKQKQPLQTLEPGRVRLYVCGMTVYDYCHLGHARVMVSFDVIIRYLRHQGLKVNYIRNITDIDDKIIQRAEEQHRPYTEVTEQFISAMHADAAALSVLPPDEEPRATAYIEEMQGLIQSLLNKGYAYQAENGDVYYAVNRFKNYGQLAQQDLENLRAGARVAVSEVKQDPLDFVLWKLAKPGEPSWTSPWGEGRPGWHIECSAMAMHCLGEQIDIHGGGIDLTFPHHTNEIAQSEAVTEKPFVKTWMHVGFLQIDAEKMSKSLGNFLTIRDVLQEYPAEIVRYFLVASHYRSPLNYSQQSLAGARAALERFYLALRDLPIAERINDSVYEQRFLAAMDDDFNTPEALAALFDLAREINRLRQDSLAAAASHGALLKELAAILGLLQQSPQALLQTGLSAAEKAHIEALIKQRNDARAKRDWQTADQVRELLNELDVELEDKAEVTLWRRKS